VAAPKADAIEDEEAALIDKDTQSRLSHLHGLEAAQHDREQATARKVMAEFLAAEREAGQNPAKVQAIRIRRERAAMIVRQLSELEEERISIHARAETRAALEARLRVAAAQARCEELQRLVDRAPQDGAQSLTKQIYMLEGQVDELDHEGARVRAVLQLDMATEGERWHEAKAMVEGLEDEVEALRVGLARTLSELEAVDATRRSKRAAAEKVARAQQITPLVKECDDLERQALGLRETLGAKEQEALKREDEVKQNTARLAAEEAEINAEIARLTAREAELTAAVEAERAAKEAAALAAEQQEQLDQQQLDQQQQQQ